MRFAVATLVLLIGAAGCRKDRPPRASGDPAVELGEGEEAQTSTQRRDHAARLLAEGGEARTMKARSILLEVTKESPKDAVAWFDLGVASWRLGALEAAAEAFSRATAADGRLAAAWRALGLVEQQLGDASSALRRFEKGLALAPDDMDLHVGRIGALRALGRSRDAVEAAKAALAVNAKSLRVYNLMGLTWLDLGELDLARFVYEKAETVEGAEADPSVQANYGWALYRAGERYAAEQRLRRAVELDRTFVPGLVYLARLLVDDHNWTDAAPLLEAARALAPDNHGVLVDLGVAYRGLGRHDDARQAWERALQLRPSDPAPHFNLGILLGDDLKRYDEAVARFTAYIDAKGPESERARAYVAAVERERERAEAQRKRDDEKKKKAAEKEERERLLREAAPPPKAPAAPPPPAPEPAKPIAPPPAPEPAKTTAPPPAPEPAKPTAPTSPPPAGDPWAAPTPPAPAPEPEPAPSQPAPAPSPWDAPGGR